MRRILKCLNERQSGAVKVYEDNQSCLKMLESGKLSNRTKHVDAKYHFVRDLSAGGEIVFEYCPTENMLADLLTKPLGKTRLRLLREKIGLLSGDND